MPSLTPSRVVALALTLVLWGVAAAGAHAQQVIETDPAVPTVNGPVTIQFDANAAGVSFGGDVYAHTGVYTDQSPNEWTCVKNQWPTSDAFDGERADTRLTEIGGGRYELTIDDIRAYYNANETGCTLGEDETITSMNFVFRNTEGDTQTDDLFVELGDPNATLSLAITNPQVPDLNPLIVENGETVTVDAEAVESGEDLEELALLLDGEVQTTTTETTLSYPLTFTTSGTRTLEVRARGTDGTEIVEGFDVVVAPPVADEARPAGIEDGITYTSETSVTLSMYGPDKENVYVIGDFNDWTVSNDYAMKRDPNGAESGGEAHWWITIDGLEPGQEYRFQYLVDGEIRMSDPFSAKVLSPDDRFIDNTTYPGLIAYPDEETTGMVSVLQTDQPTFDFSEFERPDPDELVVYELLLRDFVEESTYSTLTDTLDYLDNLGVNAVELMPVANFDGNISWGYNPNHHLALEKSYGTPQDFKQFVDEAHQRGIAVILDVVYNHATNRSPLIQIGVDALRGPGHAYNVFNHLNHDHPYIQYWVDRANAHWLTEYNVDGFRFDLTKGFASNDLVANNVDAYNADRVENLRRMATEAWQVDPEAYLIMEHFQREEELELASHERNRGRQGLMFWNGMSGPYGEAAMGYLDSDADLRGAYHPNIGLSPAAGNAVTYMESHDQQWLMRKMKEFGNASEDGAYDTTELSAALDRQKLMGGFFLTIPGPRMLWQFGELGYGWGPDECLKPGGSGNGDCTPADPGRTSPKPVRWDYNEDPARRAVYETWASLLNLRDDFAPFEALQSVDQLDVSGSSTIRRITLTDGEQQAYIIGNFGLTEQETTLDMPAEGTWYDFFPGTPVDITSADQDMTVSLQPSEFHVFTNEPVDFPAQDWAGYGALVTEQLAVSIDRGFGGAPATAANYRLVALPGNAEVPLSDAVDGRAERDWQAYWDNGSDSDFLVRFDGSDTFTFRPGRGFWLTSRENWTYSADIDALALDASGTTTIPVHEGWNIISNPLAASVDWSAVEAANGGTLNPAWSFDGTFSEAATFRSATAGTAYYFLNDDADRTTLTIPAPRADARASARTNTAPAMLELAASPANSSADTRPTSTVRMGVQSSANAVVAPPTAFEAVSLRIQPREQAAPRPERTRLHMAEARALTGDGETFNLALSAAAEGPVTLQPGALHAVQGHEAVLIDAATGTTYDLRTNDRITLSLDEGEARTLRVAIGTAGYVDRQTETAQPTELTLTAYPNPVQAQATMAYTLPEAGDVRLEVYDMLGRRVQVIENRRRDAGSYEATFTATDLASGVYFGRLTIDGETRTRKITVVR